MEEWKKDSRREPVITDLDALVPKDHLLRKIEKSSVDLGIISCLTELW